MVASEGGSYIKLNSRVERTEAHGFYEHIGYTHKKTQKYFYKKL
jgi:ribosomal protein S18 acetylase RimI-like enzyme